MNQKEYIETIILKILLQIKILLLKTDQPDNDAIIKEIKWKIKGVY